MEIIGILNGEIVGIALFVLYTVAVLWYGGGMLIVHREVKAIEHDIKIAMLKIGLMT